MTLKSIITTWINGQKPDAADFNAWGKAIKATTGMTDDNDGAPVVPRVPPFFYPVKASDTNFAGMSLTGTHLVPAGKVLIVTGYYRAAAAGVLSKITPSGKTFPGTENSIIAAGGSTEGAMMPVLWFFGPGDTFTVASGDFAQGFYVSTHTEITPVMKGLTSDVQTYSDQLLTVSAGKALWVTGIIANGIVGTGRILLNGNNFSQATQLNMPGATNGLRTTAEIGEGHLHSTMVSGSPVDSSVASVPHYHQVPHAANMQFQPIAAGQVLTTSQSTYPVFVTGVEF